MAQIKCKMCGGVNEVSDSQTILVCDYCAAEQTIAKLDSERKTMLFNRANTARINSDFDTALRLYETILLEYPNEPEAHWGVCLSRYGIEYVDDPVSKKKIPTCHRTLFNSIFEDFDYKEAINNADAVAKNIYQNEAMEIDRIQKSILAISQREEPFDIFICYKETDDAKNRTRDSLIAQDLYEELTNKGYKVFYARITLESKLGSQYEPIIFAALQSSKVMLVIGTKPQYFNAVWVKNEWRRFLSFMQEDSNKYLIPCFRDMEAYDMPEEFISLQSQDINKLGFKQDLLRGIDKIFGRDNTRMPQTDDYREPVVRVTKDYTTLIEAMIDTNHFDKAEEFALKGVEEDTTNHYYWYIQGYCILRQDLNRHKEANIIFKQCFTYCTNEEKQQYIAEIQKLYAPMLNSKLNNAINGASKLSNTNFEAYYDSVDEAIDIYYLKGNPKVEFSEEIINIKRAECYMAISKAIFKASKEYTDNQIKTYKSYFNNSFPLASQAKSCYENLSRSLTYVAAILDKSSDVTMYNDTALFIVEVCNYALDVIKNIKDIKGYKKQSDEYSYRWVVDYSAAATDMKKLYAAEEKFNKIKGNALSVKQNLELLKNYSPKVAVIKATIVTTENLLEVLDSISSLCLEVSNNQAALDYIKESLGEYFPQINNVILTVIANMENIIKTRCDMLEVDFITDLKILLSKIKNVASNLITEEIYNKCEVIGKKVEEAFYLYHPETKPVKVIEEPKVVVSDTKKDEICKTAEETLKNAFAYSGEVVSSLYRFAMKELNAIVDYPKAKELIEKYEKYYNDVMNNVANQIDEDFEDDDEIVETSETIPQKKNKTGLILFVIAVIVVIVSYYIIIEVK